MRGGKVGEFLTHEPGKRADLLLVGGDPTRTISDSLSIRAVWRQGTRLPFEPLTTSD